MLKKIAALVLSIFLLSGCTNMKSNQDSSVFKIIAGSENKDLEPLLAQFAKENKIPIQVEYAGTIDIMQSLNKDTSVYDAVWLSNSIWLYMLEDSSKIKYAKFTSINPIVFGVTMAKATALGFTDPEKPVYMQDILQAVQAQQLHFIMPSATQTNSGASAYLGFLSSLAGNPEVLTHEDLQNPELKSQLKDLFKGVARSSGDEAFAGEIFLNGGYDAIVNYEASIIQLNKELTAKGKEPLYLVYPSDGVSLSDSPFAYIDNKDPEKQKQFNILQGFLLSDSTQRELTKTGRRAGYGGLVPYGDKETFNPKWGIDTNHYLSPIKYPSAAVMREALNLYQDELKKPARIIFCLDYSGSMSGDGVKSLQAAMAYILDYDRASVDFLQFSANDVIGVIPFDSTALGYYETQDGADTSELLKNIMAFRPGGGTNIYDPSIEALSRLKDYDPGEYARSIILMTDGKSNNGSFRQLEEVYTDIIGQEIPIFSITFGSADKDQLEQIAGLTSGKVMDGTKDLVAAFKNVRGYN